MKFYIVTGLTILVGLFGCGATVEQREESDAQADVQTDVQADAMAVTPCCHFTAEQNNGSAITFCCGSYPTTISWQGGSCSKTGALTGSACSLGEACTVYGTQGICQ